MSKPGAPSDIRYLTVLAKQVVQGIQATNECLAALYEEITQVPKRRASYGLMSVVKTIHLVRTDTNSDVAHLDKRVIHLEAA